MTMAEEPPTEHKVPFRIGYALAQKKTQSFLQEKLCRESLNKGVQLIQIDLTRSLCEQGPFDAILHKINRQEWYDELASYQLSHPDVLVVDPPEAIQRLYNRLSMLQVVGERRVYDSGCSVGVPRQIFVDDHKHLIEKFEASGLEFPVIAKPLMVDGTHKSHIMWLVYNEEGLRKLAPPLVIQEFVNHGGVIFKVFVVGGAVRCVRRHSLPDTVDTDFHNKDGLKSFCQVSNLKGIPRREAELVDAKLSAHVPLPPWELISAIASRLRRKLGLQLFNFDLIREAGLEERFCIVDINYFPGFAKMPGYEHVMSDFFVSLAEKKYGLRCLQPTP